MASPFPGMDPYLEDDQLWPAFQHQLVHSLYQILLPGLMDKYRARVAQRHYVNEQALFTSVIREEHTNKTSKSASAKTASWSPWAMWSARRTKPPPRAVPPTSTNAAK